MRSKLSRWVFVLDIVVLLVFSLSRWQIDLRLEGPGEITIESGEAFDEPGAVAEIHGKDVHFLDGNVRVKRIGNVDSSQPGTYTLSYRASRLFYHDSAERIVHVVSGEAPTLTLNDVKTELDAGDIWEDSYSAYDDFDGDITDRVQITGAVDTAQAGLYTLLYSVTDSAGNTTTAERSVHVFGVSEPVEGSKIVFLTFDDGPCANTDELLGILDRHNVKVTFFVTGNGGSYTDRIGKEAEAGHTVAVHSLTHNFNQVYASEQAYWDDFDAMNDIIEQYTGYRARIFRFPGGSSNTISSFNPGIMTRLTEQAHELGYEYFDWNVDSGDGGGVDDPDQIFANVTAGIAANNISVVLCHDTHHTTVEAIDRILNWCEENGYTLMPLAKGITVCHHGVAN